MHRTPLMLAGLVVVAITASVARATDIGIAGRKFIVLDKLAAAGKAKTVFLTTRDAVVTKGSGTDPLQIEAALDVVYGSARGAFVMPQGPNWLVNGSTLAKYVNRDSPIGGAVKANVIQSGQFLKVVARSLGDTSIDISQSQHGLVSVAYTVTNGAETIRLCSHFVGCEHKSVAGGTGSKVVCIGNLEIPTTIGDGACVAAAGPPAAVTMVSAGEAHTCAVLDIGAVRCWGANGCCGVRGDGSFDVIGDDEPPTAAGFSPIGGKVVQIAAGALTTCALLDGGAVRCWGGRILGYGDGSGGFGQYIGDDDPAGAGGDVPVGGTVTQLAMGSIHTCALLDTGAVRCWGHGQYGGHLGYGNTNDIGDDETPASAGDVDVGGTVVQITAAAGHTCALLDTGAVRCWGNGQYGELGYGNTNNIGDDETPASAGDVDVGGTVVQIAAGLFHTCALLDTGRLRCWGAGTVGMLGYGNTGTIGDNETPASAGDVDVGGTVVQVAAGGTHTCALLDTGAVRCWGWGFYGQLGYGNTNDIGDNETPASAGDVDVGGTVVRIATGDTHTCAVMATGKVRCWGDGAYGQLGYGSSAFPYLYTYVGDNETPASVGDVPLF